jgi:hypothetical protein
MVDIWKPRPRRYRMCPMETKKYAILLQSRYRAPSIIAGQALFLGRCQYAAHPFPHCTAHPNGNPPRAPTELVEQVVTPGAPPDGLSPSGDNMVMTERDDLADSLRHLEYEMAMMVASPRMLVKHRLTPAKNTERPDGYFWANDRA